MRLHVPTVGLVVLLSLNIHQMLFFSSICQQYEEITATIRSTPENTEQLVSLDQFRVKTSEETVFTLIGEIKDAIYRLRFLMECAILPCMSNFLPYIHLKITCGALMHQIWLKSGHLIFATKEVFVCPPSLKPMM